MKKFKLIVFDIDETLFSGVEVEKDTKLPKGDHELQHGNIKYRTYKRPYLDEFINFCKKKL